MAIAALARKDGDDLALLRTTCPMKTYQATDEDFQQQWEQSARVVRLFSMWWLTTLVRLCEASGRRKYVQAARDYYREGYIAGGNAAWEEAGKEEAYLTPDDFVLHTRTRKDDTGQPDKWETEYIERCCELKTMWVGFTRFCAAVSFEPEALLGWWSGAGEYIEQGRAILDSDLPIDDDAANELCRMYVWLWNQQEMVVGEVDL